MKSQRRKQRQNTEKPFTFRKMGFLEENQVSEARSSRYSNRRFTEIQDAFPNTQTEDCVEDQFMFTQRNLGDAGRQVSLPVLPSAVSGTLPAINVNSPEDANDNQIGLVPLPRIESSNHIKLAKLNTKYLSRAKLFTSCRIQYTSLPKTVYQIGAITETARLEGIERKENKDAFLVINDFAGVKNQYLTAIFDGHGVYGGKLAHYLKDNLPRNIQQNMSLSLKYSTGGHTKPDETRQMKHAVMYGYRQTLKDLFRELKEKVQNSGTTCTILLIRGNIAITLHVGDSMALLGTKDYHWQSTVMNDPHFISRADKQRIEKLGGVVQGNPPLIYIQDLFPAGPALSVTRVVGNLNARHIGVSYKPEVKVHTLTPQNKMIILATNGFWCNMDEDDCIKLAGRYWRRSSSKGVVSFLLQQAQENAELENPRNVDSMTVIGVFLKVGDSKK